MKVLSFDMGTRNLAFALIEGPEYKILRMGVIDLGKDAARPATDALVHLLTSSHSWMLDPGHDVVIELQPRNGAPKIISHVLQGIFGHSDAHSGISREVRFMQAKGKFAFNVPMFDDRFPTTYKERKDCAMAMAELILADQAHMHEHYMNQHYKHRTDLADAVLQGCRHIQERTPN